MKSKITQALVERRGELLRFVGHLLDSVQVRSPRGDMPCGDCLLCVAEMARLLPSVGGAGLGLVGHRKPGVGT